MIGRLDNDTLGMLTTAKMSTGNNWGCGVILYDPVTCNVLLGERTDTHNFCTPGGKVEVGETVLNAVKRECLEESGLKLNSAKFMGYRVHTSPNGKNWVSFMFFSTDFSGGIKAQESEIVSWNWVDFMEAFGMELFDATKKSFELAYETCLVNPSDVDNPYGVDTERINGDGNGYSAEPDADTTELAVFEAEDFPHEADLYRHGHSEECCAYSCTEGYPPIWD